jgi:hypothetical protein
MGIWIEERIDKFHAVGDKGFLVETSWNIRQRKNEFTLHELPLRGNESGEIRLSGWAGTTNDIAQYGHGVAEVVKVARNGRSLVRQLSGREAAAALRELGYEDLAEDIPSTSTYTVELPTPLYESIGKEAKVTGKTINQVIIDRLGN